MNNIKDFEHSVLTVNDLKKAIPEQHGVIPTIIDEDEDDSDNDQVISTDFDDKGYLRTLIGNLGLENDFLLIDNSHTIVKAASKTRIESEADLGVPGITRNGVVVTTSEDFVFALAELIIIADVNQLGQTVFTKDYQGFSALVRWQHVTRFFNHIFNFYSLNRKEFFDQKKFYCFHPHYTIEDWQRDEAEIFGLDQLTVEKKIVLQLEQQVYTPTFIVKKLNQQINQLRRIRMKELGTIYSNAIELF